MSIITSLTFNSIIGQFVLNPALQNAEAYAVSNFIGVNTIYTISTRNNRFAFIESTSSSTTRIATIPIGNYTLSSFIAALALALTTAGTVTYTCVNDTLTNR